jgi:nucleoside-diphosphate-sugar epimerase
MNICDIINQGVEIEFLAKNNAHNYLDISIGTGYAPRIRDIVEFIKEITSTTAKLEYGAIPLRENEPEICIADTSIIENTGWKAKYSWRDGIKKMLEKRVIN